jgi:predicted molibdopterin-dependent oxidoreductase YjgC
MLVKLTLDGNAAEAKEHELLIELLQRRDTKVSAVCYHHQLGPIQTCDTCLLEVNGKLVRACATPIVEGMEVETKSARADAAQREAFDQILRNHMLYCTVCSRGAPDPRWHILPAILYELRHPRKCRFAGLVHPADGAVLYPDLDRAWSHLPYHENRGSGPRTIG